MAISYISLGANLGERFKTIAKAVKLLGADKKIKIRKKSAVYETEPVGGPPQGYFLNQVIEVETVLFPGDLLKTLKRIETKLGRKKGERRGPRVIDLDILFFDDLVLKQRDLEIPHPELTQRRFILAPLSGINPAFSHPVLKIKIKNMLENLKDNKEVSLYCGGS